MSSTAIGLVLVVLVISAIVAWLWGERRAQNAQTSGAKMLSSAEGQVALLTERVTSLTEQLSGSVKQAQEQEAIYRSRQVELLEKEERLRGEVSQATAQVAGLQEKLSAAQLQANTAKQEQGQLQVRLQDEQQALRINTGSLAGEKEKALAVQKELSAKEKSCIELKNELSEKRENLDLLRNRLAQTEANFSAEKEKLGFARDMERTITAVASQVIKKSGEELNTQQHKQIEATLAPITTTLGNLKKQVEEADRARVKEQGQLGQRLEDVLKASTQLNEGAQNLTRALKGDNKVAGDWGEVVLARVLEMSGLYEGREFFTQASMKNEEGQTLRPDVVIQLPENRCLIVDSKVSLKHWESFTAGSDGDWDAVGNSIKQHLKGLSSKNYEDLHGAASVDYVLMFIPIEPLFLELARHSPAVLQDAWQKRIMIVGPSTLQWALRSVSAIWKFEYQNLNAQEIATQAGAMHDKFVGFLEDMKKIEKALGSAQTAYDGAFSKLKAGRGNLVGRTDRLRSLGARTKKEIPESLLDGATDVEPPELA